MNKLMGAGDVVGQLASGMTIGIGGWGPRRKAMALVRGRLRPGLEDSTPGSYGGPHAGMWWAAGQGAKNRFSLLSGGLLHAGPEPPPGAPGRRA